MTDRPHSLFGPCALVILLSSVFGINSEFDLQMHDTYWVLMSWHVGVFLSFFCVVIGMIYWIFRSYKLVKVITFAHVVITVMVIGALQIAGLSFDFIIRSHISEVPDLSMVKDMADLTAYQENVFVKRRRCFNSFVLLALKSGCFAQLLLILNLLISGIRHLCK